jgi:D-3-phosphoglycerate dehydrogenase
MVGHTLELYEALAPAALENITRILRGDLPLYCKNPHIEQKWRERLALLA